MKKSQLKTLTLTAVFAALIAVMTAFIKIPIGMNGGYIHVGDSIVYLAGCLLGPYAAIAASIGGALADVLAGAPLWAFSTAIIKPCNCLPFILATMYYVKRHGSGSHRIVHLSTILMTVVSGFVTVLGYFVAEGLMYSFSSALGSVVFNVIQAVGSAIIFIVIGVILDKTHIQKYLH